jgi:hypothetical protein
MHVERISYLGLRNCYRFDNGAVEVIVTTDVGPRVIRYAFVGASNVFGEYPERSTSTQWGDWKPRGGHRLWAAPEAMPRSYAPDNSPIAFEIQSDRAIRLQQSTDLSGLEKEMTVSVETHGTAVCVDHKITNRSLWPIELAPWAITIVRGGLAILPLEPWRSHREALGPAQPLVRWYFTDFTDPRLQLGRSSIRVRADATLQHPQKIGILNRCGWCAHWAAGTLFVKHFDVEKRAHGADYGANNEAYVAGEYMELESLGPLQRLAPNESAAHRERWELFRHGELSDSEPRVMDALHSLLHRGDSDRSIDTSSPHGAPARR